MRGIPFIPGATAPFRIMIGASAMGFLVFGDLPSAWTWLGAGVIIASGLYVAYREAVRAKERRAKA